MSALEAKRTKAEDPSRVDDLLRLFGRLSQPDPSPALRERLSALAAQRLREDGKGAVRLGATRHRWKSWWLPVLAPVVIGAIALTAVLVGHLRWQESTRASRSVQKTHGEVSPVLKASVSPAPRPATPRPNVSRRAGLNPGQSTGTRRMTMRLPYSNSEIQTGTDATIRVSISQSDLLSLGFPIPTTVRDRRILAEVTLGDDGLPRTISLPVPLEILKEQR
jgi:hypothetical protein